MSMRELVRPPTEGSCDEHDYENIQPIVIASAKFGFRSLQADKSSIIAETQSLFETISIPNTAAKLVYSSPRTIHHPPAPAHARQDPLHHAEDPPQDHYRGRALREDL